jgi:pimeloyl-ACP methyl ester carboxylesterase
VSATTSELVAVTADGVTLRIQRVPGGTAAPIVCLHAMMTDARYFGARKPDGFAATLAAAAGRDVFVAEFRGHGRSQPPRAGAEDWTFDDLVEHDLPAILDACAAAAGCAVRDLTVLGHSLGGLVTTAALGTGRVPALRLLVLAATAPWLGGGIERRAVLHLYRAITRLVGRAPVRALRFGTADEPRAYVRQLTGWGLEGRWTSCRGVDYLAALGAIRTPVIPYTGARDWMCTVEDATGFARRIPGVAAVRVVGTRSGDAIDPDHFELFTRRELAPQWRELGARIAGLPAAWGSR